MPIFRTVLWAIVALVAGAAVTLAVIVGWNGTTSGQAEAAYGGTFRLLDGNGAEITEAALKGRPSAVFFGFTHCPDVCPTTLYSLAGYQKQLKAEGKDINVVLVTVDPERDTPAVLKDYTEAVSPDVTAITGEPEKVQALLKSWGIYAKKQGEGDDYVVDHSAMTILLDRNGAFAGTIAYEENPDTALAKLEKLAGA